MTTKISTWDLIFFFKRCPSLEFIQISLAYLPQTPTIPRRRVCLAALRELRLDEAACTTGLLDHLILPRCTEMALKGEFARETLTRQGSPAAQIRPSSIGYLPATRGITKAMVMEGSCTFSGPSGNLSFPWFYGIRENLDAHFFTSVFPVSVLQIREFWIGERTRSRFNIDRIPCEKTAAGLRGAFEVLTNVEYLTLTCCKMEPFFQTLEAAVNGGILLPGSQNLTAYVGCGNLDASALTQCTKAGKAHFLPLREVTIVWEKDPGLFWRGDECGW